MKPIVKLLGIAICIVGAGLIAMPDLIYDWADGVLDDKGLYYAAIIGRLLFGLILLRTASESKFPNVIKVLGGIAVLAAVVFVFIGHDSFRSMIASVVLGGQSYAPLLGLISMLFGGFLVYAFSTNDEK